MIERAVFASIVTFNSAAYIARCLESLAGQEWFVPGESLLLQVTDNASRDGTLAELERAAWAGLHLRQNPINLGFAAAHNQAVQTFLKSDAGLLLILNPDLRLERDALELLTRELSADPQAGLATPRLYRAQQSLQPAEPLTFDAAGMVLTPSLRHFDRGSQQLDRGQYGLSEYVFGGTGACLLLKRECVVDLLLKGERCDAAKFALYPELQDGEAERAALFDEAFFAYREDADLAWRARLLGWKCRYVAAAKGYHKRLVLPERRSSLAPELNLLGVRNRFLLQINNFSLRRDWRCIVPGLVVRNFVVAAAVLLKERSSLPAFGQLIRLMPRALERRRILFGKVNERSRRLVR